MNPQALLRRLLLLFWSFYFTLVTASNMINGFQEAGMAPSSWTFTSGNFGFIAEAVSIYTSSRGFVGILFVLVVLIQLVVAVLFWAALRENWRLNEGGSVKVTRAFIPAVGMFAGFLIADEVFIVYDRLSGLESDHFLVMCALLLSLIVIDRK